MKSIQLEKINKELITFTKSDFLKNEINQAFFIWNQNEFYTKDFSDISPEDPRYPLFLDWFIYDYVIISTKKSLAEMYWEDNKDKIDTKILTTYRSIYKFKKLEDDIYLIEDIIQNMHHEIKINTEIPIDSTLLSMRIVPNDDFVSNISHIVAFNKQYKDIVYNSITNIITKNNAKNICIDLFYIIEKEINKSIASSEIESNDSENSTEVHYKVDNYKELVDNIANNSNIEFLIEEDNEITLYKYYDNLKNEYGSFRLSEKNITFDNFSTTALTAVINDLGPFISKIGANNVSEQWLNTNLTILGNKTPLEAVKYKKYFKKIKEIINDLELIYESRTSNDEPFIDPRYVVKRLEINKD